MNNIKKNILLSATALGLVFAFNTSANAESAVEKVRKDAQVAFSDGSYKPQTWDEVNHTYIEGESTTEEAVNPGEKPLSSAMEFDLSNGPTNLATVAGGTYNIDDPTAEPGAVNLDPTTYLYEKTSADGSKGDVNLAPEDISEGAVLSTDGYDYKVTKKYRVDKKKTINIETAPKYADYQFIDGNDNKYNLANFVDETTGELLLSKPLYEGGPTLGDNETANKNANRALDAYNSNTGNYNTVLGYYNTSNGNFQAAVQNEMDDQGIVDDAVEAYRQEVGAYMADKLTYDNYGAAKEALEKYTPSLSHIIDDKAEAKAEIYADAEKERAISVEGDIANLEAQNAGNLAEKGSTIAEHLAAIDTRMGTIHGLADKLGEDYKGNLAEGTTIEDHLTAIDSSIGDRRNIASHNEAVNKGTAISVADGLKAAGDMIGDADFSGTNYAFEAEDLSSAIKDLDASMRENQALNDARFNSIDRRIRSLRNEMKRGLASTAALAGLVPLDHSYKTQLSMSMGGYENKQAVAFGGFHYLKDNVILNAGIAYGGNHSTAYKVGVSFGF